MTSGIRGAFLLPLCTSMAGGNPATEVDQLKEQIEKYQATTQAAMIEASKRQFQISTKQDRLEKRLDTLQFTVDTFIENLNNQFMKIRGLLEKRTPAKMLKHDQIWQEGSTGIDKTDPKVKEVLQLPSLPESSVKSTSNKACVPAATNLGLAMEMRYESRDQGVRMPEQVSGPLKPSNAEQSPVVQIEGIKPGIENAIYNSYMYDLIDIELWFDGNKGGFNCLKSFWDSASSTKSIEAATEMLEKVGSCHRIAEVVVYRGAIAYDLETKIFSRVVFDPGGHGIAA